jgi:hypothetical protein
MSETGSLLSSLPELPRQRLSSGKSLTIDLIITTTLISSLVVKSDRLLAVRWIPRLNSLVPCLRAGLRARACVGAILAEAKSPAAHRN